MLHLFRCTSGCRSTTGCAGGAASGVEGDIRPRQRVQGHGRCMREPRCGFPWWKRRLGYDCQQSEQDLQGGRCVGDRELQDPRELKFATLPPEAAVGGVLAPSLLFINELEEICINEPDLQFNIPKNMEEPKLRFEYKPTFTAQSRRKQERRNEGYSGQDAFGSVDANDLSLRWYTVSELSDFICELCKLHELEYMHERCHEINQREKATHTTFRRMQSRDPGPPTSHGGRQQCSGHDHDYTGTCVFQIEEGAVPRGFREHDGGSGGAVLRIQIREAFVRDERCGHVQKFRRVEEKTSIFVIDKDLGNVAYSSWIKSVLDQGTMYELLGQTTNEESL